MQSTLTVHETDPHDIFVIEPDVVLAARPDAARPDAVRTDSASADPVHEALSRLAHQRADIQPKFSATAATPSPTVDTTFRAAAVDHAKATGKRSGFGRLVRNTFVGFLFALVSAMAAALWTHHGNAAKQMLADYWPPAKQTIAGWLPPFVVAASSPTEPPPVAEQPSVSPTQTATADQMSTPPAQPSDNAAPAQAVAAAELLAVDAIDGARHRHDGATDRAAQSDHRAAQGQSGADRARCCQIIRSRPAAAGRDAAAKAGRWGGVSTGAKAKAGHPSLPAVSLPAVSTGSGLDLAAAIGHRPRPRPAAAVTARAVTASHDRGWPAGGAAAATAALVSAGTG